MWFPYNISHNTLQSKTKSQIIKTFIFLNDFKMHSIKKSVCRFFPYSFTHFLNNIKMFDVEIKNFNKNDTIFFV